MILYCICNRLLQPIYIDTLIHLQKREQDVLRTIHAEHIIIQKYLCGKHGITIFIQRFCPCLRFGEDQLFQIGDRRILPKIRHIEPYLECVSKLRQKGHKRQRSHPQISEIRSNADLRIGQEPL